MRSTYEKPVIRFGDLYYTVRGGDVGEPRIVIESVGEKQVPQHQRSLQFYANLPHRGILPDYVPVLAYAMAYFLVKEFDGELIEATEMR